MTGETPAGGTTVLAASSTLKWVGGMSGSGACLIVTTMSIAGKVSECCRDDFRNIANRECFLDVEGANAVLEHRDAERAGHGDAVCFGVDGLVQTVVADARAALFLHERPGAARATAKAAVAAARHLGEAAGNRGHDLARLVVNLVVATQVARVVVGEAFAIKCPRGHLQPTRLDQFLDELAVVNHLVVAAKRRVFVLERVEAVRATRHDAPARAVL